jgi:hypothetical protein
MADVRDGLDVASSPCTALASAQTRSWLTSIVRKAKNIPFVSAMRRVPESNSRLIYVSHMEIRAETTLTRDIRGD